ncbi:MAG: FAD-binding molybdopterin dehydrogenase [Rhodospirillales bacterium 69-11]|nr:xanthine dehydrogenase family protein subunit M [Rhodospirillales bacterium]OJW26015.1 MAG: FAD-binding molybdopterin dehydrogenase [Rhodospirillales bacterium 69-11]
MQAFTLTTPDGLESATAAAAQGGRYIGGGTDLLQLAKNDVETPDRLIDLEPLPLTEITATDDALRLGAMARMSDVAAHPAVVARWPVISQSLLASASPQVRNMGTIGGNLLQRTRCGYFRDTGFACNKRAPGSGCPAIQGENRMLAILGTSDHCIASHPSDLAVALIILDASVELRATDGTTRTLPLSDLHRLPGDTPHVETTLAPGELITAVSVPASRAAMRSHYLKVRDRASFEFALVSAAVAVDAGAGTVHDIRVAAGGVGAKPWRLPEVEEALRGRPLTPKALADAAALAGQGAKPASQNGFKQVLLRRAVLRALQTATA